MAVHRNVNWGLQIKSGVLPQTIMSKPRKTGRGNARAIKACQRALKMLCREGAVTPSTETAKAVGVSRFAMWKWDVVPPLRVPAISRLTGIRPHRLRPDLPDLFPPPRKRKGA